jgi:hypothetical protein
LVHLAAATQGYVEREIGGGLDRFEPSRLCKVLLLWNGSKLRFARIRAARQFFLRKLGCQGARFARRRSRFHPSYDGQATGQGCLVVVTVQPDW